MRTILSLAAFLAAGPVWAAPVPMREDYQKKADEAPWQWSDERATAAGSARRLKGDYRAEVEPRGTSGGAVIRIVKDGAAVHSFDGHQRTVFAVRDDVLYYAVFHPSSSGCAVVAFDLKAKKQLWKTHLRGLRDGRPHSVYRNAVLLDLDGQAVCVRGQEAFGNYIEYVDLRTGKTVGHKVYPRK
jgi:hypothetical protein